MVPRSGGSFCLYCACGPDFGPDLAVVALCHFRCEMGCDNRLRGGPFVSVFCNAVSLAHSGDASRMDVSPALWGDYCGVDSVIQLAVALLEDPCEQAEAMSEPETKPREIVRLDKLKRDFGTLVIDALNDSRTIEILLNPDGTLWQERLGEKMKPIGHMPPSRAESVMRTIASALGTTITRNNPILEGELPLDGSRFAGLLPPVVSAPMFAIRKRASAIYSLDQYVVDEIMSSGQKQIICTAVAGHKNIVVSGGTGSGKTTLINAIIGEMVVCDPDERIVIIEDTGEIQCSAANCSPLHTSLEISMTKLLKTTLRVRPDRIIVGEVRGPEALDLLMAWNTGHAGGCATLHANTAKSALDRLAMLISMNPDAPRVIEPFIASAVDVVVQIAKTPDGRRVQELIEVRGYENGYETQNIGRERE